MNDLILLRSEVKFLFYHSYFITRVPRVLVNGAFCSLSDLKTPITRRTVGVARATFKINRVVRLPAASPEDAVDFSIGGAVSGDTVYTDVPFNIGFGCRTPSKRAEPESARSSSISTPYDAHGI